MNCLKACTLTVLFSTLTLAQEGHAATLSPPVEAQVKQVAEWFTGIFDNSQQVAANPSVPLINLSTCEVQLASNNPSSSTKYIYLEQTSTAFNRIRFYSFSPDDNAIKLGIRSFINNNLLNGICNKPTSQRLVDISNISTISCDLNLVFEPSFYFGTNAPNGCPTSSGGKVVSQVSIYNDTIDSLDQIFTANGTLTLATPIVFKKIQSVPEPRNFLGLMVFGLWFAKNTYSKKVKQQSKQKEKVCI